VSWDRQTIDSFDAIVISTDHASVDYSALAEWGRLVVDTRNAMAGIDTPQGKVWKA
jgi:UDP-N-acetyl-D-glucosamine dehydrogenase